ncbi:hypothetical protein P5673_031287 [Acropora cervicornis]|uniref:Uncharacterized protein n=1 Tax=Acropora cervicornis TaxID=6130 RepID=A0AAD9PT00_ACRCE|nr:hypothetical protein P5673_031287 [Acropora cervicornis]
MSFCEEMRNIKKSMELHGTGAKEVYVSQWKFFDECKFPEEVIISNRRSFCNSQVGEHLPGQQISFEGDTGSEVNRVISERQHPKRKKKNIMNGDSSHCTYRIGKRCRQQGR